MQNLNFIMSQFPKQSRWKEYPRENNTRTTKVWENVVQTRLGGEFWACDVITHKTYYTLDKLYRKQNEQSPQLASKSHEICSSVLLKYSEFLFSLYYLLFILAQTVGNPLPSAFFDEQVTGGRHPNDDKRYTIGKLTNFPGSHSNQRPFSPYVSIV